VDKTISETKGGKRTYKSSRLNMQYSYQTYYVITIKKEVEVKDCKASLLMFYNREKKEFQPLLTKECLHEEYMPIGINVSFVRDKTLTVYPIKLVPDGTGEEFDEEVVPE
jgi:hypothetical protein